MPKEPLSFVEILQNIVDAAVAFLGGIDATSGIADQADPTPAVAHLRWMKLPRAIVALRRALHPEQPPSDDRRWPAEVYEDLILMRSIVDDIVKAWGLEALIDESIRHYSVATGDVLFVDSCTEKETQKLTKAWRSNRLAEPGEARAQVPKDWPPKIDRHVGEALAAAAERLKAAIARPEKHTGDMPAGSQPALAPFVTAKEIAQIYRQTDDTVRCYLKRLSQSNPSYRISNPSPRQARDAKFLYVTTLVLPHCNRKWGPIAPPQVSE
ncbi:MAG TPA: hypothetical protein VKU02_07095 [Gemmataceae bacterium]|nr:hypothetical protein [Gemmataceae bacterium]